MINVAPVLVSLSPCPGTLIPSMWW